VSHVWEYGPAQGNDGLDREVQVIHNGDWSGDAEIVVKTVEAGSSNTYRLSLPGKCLRSFAADLFRDEMIGMVENWDPREEQ
jgi:hypothetical protein